MFRRKLAIVSSLGAVALFLSGLASAQTMNGSEHDFRAVGWNPGGELCVVCHTPHNGDVSVASEAPLWNHELSTATYVMYSRPLDGAISGTPNALSALCLSCHDGTVALDNFGGATGGTNFIGANANFGFNLEDDHPISVTYTTATASADGALFDPSTTTVTLPDATTPTIDDGLLEGSRAREPRAGQEHAP